jgi:hypothetical protein
MEVQKHNFSVVHFSKDNSIAAVPTKWISTEEGLLYCAWPKGVQIVELIKNPNSQPRSTWKKLKLIKIFNSFGNGKQR